MSSQRTEVASDSHAAQSCAQRCLSRKEDPAMTAEHGRGSPQPYMATMDNSSLGQSPWDLCSGLLSPVSGSVLNGTCRHFHLGTMR